MGNNTNEANRPECQNSDIIYVGYLPSYGCLAGGYTPVYWLYSANKASWTCHFQFPSISNSAEDSGRQSLLHQQKA